MAELTEHPLAYAEEHPYIAAAFIVGGLVLVYWLFFSGSSSTSTSTDAATTNMAAAYYAAEAAQTTAGTQLNIATVQANAQEAGQLIQAQGAVAINQSNNTAATAIASSMYNADMQDTATSSAAATAQTQLTANAYVAMNAADNQTSQVQANDAMNTSIANANYAWLTNNAADTAGVWNTAFQTVIPAEVSRTGNAIFNLGQYGTSNIYNSPIPNVNDLVSQGYSLAQANMIAATSSGIAGLSTGQFP